VKRVAVALAFVALVLPLPAGAELSPLTTRERVSALEDDVATLKSRLSRLRARVNALEERLAFQECENARLWEAIGLSSAEQTATSCAGIPTPDPAP
jgi:hypothetical protein